MGVKQKLSESTLNEDQLTEQDEEDTWIYLVGVGPDDVFHNPGQPVLDFFLEITPENKREVFAQYILGDLVDDKKEKEKWTELIQSFSSQIYAIKLRMAIHANLIPCCFKTPFPLTRDELQDYIKTLSWDEIRSAKITL
jgi:hypothetical protein